MNNEKGRKMTNEDYYPEICDTCNNTYADRQIELTSLQGEKFTFNMCESCYEWKEEETEFLPI